jgi:serine/threonine protein phosphatase 1
MPETHIGSAFPRAAYPPAPDDLVIYVIGDVHGRQDLLVGAHERIDRDKRQFAAKEVNEIYLGDYIDRGPASAEVISTLISRSNKVRARFLRGNHEQLLIEFIRGEDCLDEWKAVGGVATLLSYGITPDLLKHGAPPEAVRSALSDKLPKEHLEFLERTGSYINFGPYLAVHAGVRPGVSLEKQTTRDLLSIRSDFLDYRGDFGYIVVHGHTPVQQPDQRRNRINIDTCAFATNLLTCIRITEDGVSIIQDDGCRIAMPP